MSEKQSFAPVPAELDFPKYERAISALWKERDIFAKSLVARGPEAPSFVFYEGPPTANGLPHNGHVLTRAVKDLFPRYRSMTGHRVLRKGGWDTHGLPVEVEVEKELGIHGKEAIEAHGVEPFVARCIESVFRYTAEWERLTERIAFWVSLDDAYVTYHRSYVESVWWALSQLFSKGLLYRGHKVVWWWAQGGTALSSGEVGQGYKTVDDPSVYVELPLRDDPSVALVVWTTTPWTLPSNAYAAVNPGFDYVKVRVGEPLPAAKGSKAGAVADEAPHLRSEFLIVAAATREGIEQKLGRSLEVIEQLKGRDLVGVRYEPPFDFYAKTLADASVARRDGTRVPMWWRVVPADFVTLDTGTGIVHVAPAFGEDDHKAHMKELASYAHPDEVELLCAIKPDGTFSEVAAPYTGTWVKDADKPIIADLAERGLLLHAETYRHEYPFCWRADDDPLIQMARPAWFIRTTAELDRAIANNRAIKWLPEHIREGRFGDFLDNNVDWALSRERYWGTPLNVWTCTADEEHQHAPASVAEIEALNPAAFEHFREAQERDPSLSEHLIVHKPWVDQVVFPCPKCGAEMRRAKEVIDCWFDSGCMPFAQWGFPHAEGSLERFDAAFPADFISEAIDQTRGWFYSLLMVSSLVFDERTQAAMGLSSVRALPHPYQTCIVLGHVCDKEGKKESKSRGNYTPPEIILDLVALDFGVLEEAVGVRAKADEILIAREDLEGMDLADGSTVSVYRRDRPGERLARTVRALKRLPRRVAVVPDADRVQLGLAPAAQGVATKPVEVPRLPSDQRIVIEDETTPAPGADAFRWFFYASSPPWNNTRHSLHNVRMLQKDFVVKLRNVYAFFCIYANIDAYSPTNPAHAPRPLAERSLLDRWLGSELALTTRGVRAALDAYQLYDAAQKLIELAEGLSNWYVRRSRARFWATGLEADKLDAYATLYETLVTVSKLIAPFVPYFAEEMYQNLVVRPKVAGARESVHLADYPEPDVAVIDTALAEEMRAVREVVSLGLSVRTANKLKVRQPLSGVDVVYNDAGLMHRVASYADLIKEELNVHTVTGMHPGHEQGAVTFKLQPNFRALGPRLGKRVQEVKQALASADGGALFAELAQRGRVTLRVGEDALDFSGEELAISVSAAQGFAAETGPVGVVVLHTALTEELVDEGLVREIVSRVQARRKELQLEFTERVSLRIGGSDRVTRVAEAAREHIAAECLASAVEISAAVDGDETNLGDERLRLSVTRLSV